MRALFAYGVVATLLLVVARVRLLPGMEPRVRRLLQGDWLVSDLYFSVCRLSVKALRVFVYALVVLTATGLLFSTPDTGVGSFDTFVAGVVAVATTYQITVNFESGYVGTLEFLERTRRDYLRGSETESVGEFLLVGVYTVLFAAGLGGGVLSATLLFPLPPFVEPSTGLTAFVAALALVVGFFGAIYDVFA